MNRYSSEKELIKILGADLKESDMTDRKMQEAYEILRDRALKKNKAGRIWKNIAVGIGSAAAAFILLMTLCAMNPVLAKEIPLIGSIFEKVWDVFDFGKLPEEDTKPLYVENDETTDEKTAGNANTAEKGNASDKETGEMGTTDKNAADEEQSPYRKKDGDFTVTLTEEYATNQAVYIGVRVEYEQEFPEMHVFQTNGASFLQVWTIEDYSFRPDPVYNMSYIEGKFEDKHTFIGILRIDYSDVNVDTSKYDKAYDEAEAAGKETPAITIENSDEWLDYYEVPENFDMTLKIREIDGYPIDTSITEGSRRPGRLCWEGSWQFDLNITQQDDASRTIEINEVNEDGIGIESIELSSVELTLNTIETSMDPLTFAVALDADGKRLNAGNGNAYVLATMGHDISRIYIYICEYDDYMANKCADEEGEDGKSFQELLEEHALFKTVVETDG